MITGGGIRKAMPSDLDAIDRIERAAFEGDQLSRRSLRRFLTVATTATLVAEGGAAILGYVMVGFRSGSSAARVFSLAVAPAASRQGWGKGLLAACEAEARRRGATRLALEVRSDNHAARCLYDAAGYRMRGSLEDYYEDGASALRFEKSLPRA